MQFSLPKNTDISIHPIKSFTDKYICMIKKNKDAVIVDPGDASPVLEILQKENIHRQAILITHKHADHIGGVKNLVKTYPNVKIYGPKNNFNFIFNEVANNELVVIDELNISLRVIETPGHTLDHIVFADKDHLFCGDTIFGCGCGRLFEGTFSQMHESLKILSRLPRSIKIFCAHEYTKKNLDFCLEIEFDNHYLKDKKIWVDLKMSKKEQTIPVTLKEELNTNIFLRCNTTYVKKAIENSNLWSVTNNEKSRVLNNIAELYEENFGEIFAILSREAGKTIYDAISEVREAVDFIRYYSYEARKLSRSKPRGRIVCISPWNFPLAIFTGQIAAALSAGNVVIAKPAESTSLIAYRASELLIAAGVPVGLFQLCLGKGSEVGAYLSGNNKIAGVSFTGSNEVAKQIKKSLIDFGNIEARLIAETGGLNSMVVGSTALCEQVTRDVIDSAFKSAGQRCSALRILMIQDDSYFVNKGLYNKCSRPVPQHHHDMLHNH